MLQSRAMQQAMKRLTTTTNPSVLLKAGYGAPANTAIGRFTQIRPAATQPTSQPDAHSLLASQRRNRPVSPHLTIYKPQLTWTLSSLNRITGSILSGGFYIFGSAYLVSPLLGWHLDTATMATAFAGLPFIAQLVMKMSLTLPFTFHSFNGVRHFFWDAGRQMSNQQVIRTGWTVVGLTVGTSVALALT